MESIFSNLERSKSSKNIEIAERSLLQIPDIYPWLKEVFSDRLRRIRDSDEQELIICELCGVKLKSTNVDAHTKSQKHRMKLENYMTLLIEPKEKKHYISFGRPSGGTIPILKISI